jgi:hypothetical protein
MNYLPTVDAGSVRWSSSSSYCDERSSAAGTRPWVPRGMPTGRHLCRSPSRLSERPQGPASERLPSAAAADFPIPDDGALGCVLEPTARPVQAVVVDDAWRRGPVAACMRRPPGSRSRHRRDPSPSGFRARSVLRSERTMPGPARWLLRLWLVIVGAELNTFVAWQRHDAAHGRCSCSSAAFRFFGSTFCRNRRTQIPPSALTSMEFARIGGIGLGSGGKLSGGMGQTASSLRRWVGRRCAGSSVYLTENGPSLRASQRRQVSAAPSTAGHLEPGVGAVTTVM